MNSKYPNLLSPGYIGKVELRNKTVMAAMGMSQAENGFVNTAVLAIGNRPDTSLYDSLKDEVKEIYNIGDSNGGGIIPNAVYDGYTVGNKI